MQGTLTEIDLRSILQLIELGQRTGELLIESYYPSYGMYFQAQRGQEKKPPNYQSGKYLYPQKLVWLVFFVNGKIAYTTEVNRNNLSKLRDYLYRYQNIMSFEGLEVGEIYENNPPEYAYLWSLLEKKFLTASQSRNILHNMIQEIIFDLFNLHQGSFIFQKGSPLAPQLTSLEIEPLMGKTMRQLQLWKQLRPEIQSPSQCPIITNPEKLQIDLSSNTYQGLYRFCDGQTSLRQLSRHLNRDLVTISKAIYPYLQKGWVQLIGKENPCLLEEQDSRTNQSGVKPSLFCLDDDLTIVKTVETFLSTEGYPVTVMSEPLKAVERLFQLKPQLILCDLVMPQLDGYEICAMLRGSSLFRETPIIILTGKDSYMDRIQAKLLGATDYLTKPFGKQELLTLIEKYLNCDGK